MVASKLVWGGRAEGSPGVLPTETEIVAYLTSQDLSVEQVKALVCLPSISKTEKYRKGLVLVKELEPGAYQDYNKKHTDSKVTPLKLNLTSWQLLVHKEVLNSKVRLLLMVPAPRKLQAWDRSDSLASRKYARLAIIF